MTTPTDGADFDAATFDLDAWIDDVVRPEVTVELYPYEADYQRRVEAIEAQIPGAEKAGPENRGVNDPSPESLLAELQALRDERERHTVRVRVRQLVDTEVVAAVEAAKKAGAPEADHILWSLSAACVDEAWTPERLKRLRDRDRTGQAMVAQLVAAANTLLRGVPVPS